jgi:hypothetical protein
MKIFTFGHDPDATVLPPKKIDRVSFRLYEMGETLDQSQERLEVSVNHATGRLQSKQDQIEDEFSRPVPIPRLVEMTEWAADTTAKQNDVAKDLSSHYKEIKIATYKASQRLKELLAVAKLLASGSSVVSPSLRAVVENNALLPGNWWSNEYKTYITFPYWGSVMALNKAIQNRADVVAVLDLPSQVVAYTADQAGKALKGVGEGAREAAKGLGLPEWFIPVVLGGLGISIAVGIATKLGGSLDVSSIIKKKEAPAT